MFRLMPRFVVGLTIALLMFATSGCVSQSDFDAKVSELKTQTDKLAAADKTQRKPWPRSRSSKIRLLPHKAADKAEKDQKTAADKIEGLQKDLRRGEGRHRDGREGGDRKGGQGPRRCQGSCPERGCRQDQIARRRYCCRQGRCGQGEQAQKDAEASSRQKNLNRPRRSPPTQNRLMQSPPTRSRRRSSVIEVEAM